MIAKPPPTVRQVRSVESPAASRNWPDIARTAEKVATNTTDATMAMFSSRRERSGDIPGHWRTARCSRFLGAELGEGKEEEPEDGDPCGRYRSGEHAANPVLVVKQ